MATRDGLGGPRLVALAAALVALDVGATVAVAGLDEEGIHLLLRTTIRPAAAFFLLAFTASSLHQLVRRPFTAWLLRNRRYLGLSFAIALASHGVAILLFLRTPGGELDLTGLLGGGLAFLGTAVMAATSNDASQRRLGRHWRQLHWAFGVWIWFVLASTFGGAAAGNAVSALFTVLMTLGLAVRVAARLSARRAG